MTQVEMTDEVYNEIVQAALEAGWAVDDADEAVDDAQAALNAAIERRARAWAAWQAAEKLRYDANREHTRWGCVGQGA